MTYFLPANNLTAVTLSPRLGVLGTRRRKPDIEYLALESSPGTR